MSAVGNPDTILWEGRPRQGILIRRSEVVLLPTGALALLGGILTLIDAARSNSGMLWLDGLIFVALGLYLTMLRFIVDAVERGQTWYRVTDQAVVISRSGPLASERRIPLADVPVITDYEYAHGRGTLVFGEAHPMFVLMGGNVSWPFARPFATPRFEQIEDVRNVRAIITDAKARARR